MLLIYVPTITSRIEYVFTLVFKEELGVDYRLTVDKNIFLLDDNEKLNYSGERIDGEIFIKAAPLLFENEIKKVNIDIEKKNELVALFPNDISCDLGFDIFAAVFYMVSRYEEYLPFKRDKFGRFSATESLAYKNDFLHLPVVNLWIDLFKKLLQKKYSLLSFKKNSFSYILTYDIDVAYKFKGRSLFRNMGATFKDLISLKFKNILKRISANANRQKDDWDVYEYLEKKISQNKPESIFFFLLGDYFKHNKNLNYQHPLMKGLVNKISKFSKIGIHPSFNSSDNQKIIVEEKQRLETISNKKIIKSRQHYLKFNLPNTYNYLINAGITEDYSMGFADMPGFRAGTCKPFYFYDLKNEKATDLKIFPVTLMEGNFIKYMKLTPKKALEKIIDLIQEVQKVNGTFISIWHNHTLSDKGIYKGWQPVHDKMIEALCKPALNQVKQ